MRNLKYVLILASGLLLTVFSCKKSKHEVPVTPPPANLMAYWPLDGNGLDKSRYGNNGIVQGATPTTNRFGKANAAYHFDGGSSYIFVPDSARLRLGNTDYTLNAWVKFLLRAVQLALTLNM